MNHSQVGADGFRAKWMAIFSRSGATRITRCETILRNKTGIHPKFIFINFVQECRGMENKKTPFTSLQKFRV